MFLVSLLANTTSSANLKELKDVASILIYFSFQGNILNMPRGASVKKHRHGIIPVEGWGLHGKRKPTVFH